MTTLVSTGSITITDVMDSLHARLSSETHVVPTATDGSGGDYTGCTTTMSVFLGKQDDSENWTVTAAPTVGVIGSLVNKTYTVTSMDTDAGYVDLIATRIGFPTLISRFSITKSKQGITGSNGANAIVAVLSNEAHTVPTDSAGNNGIFTGANTTMTIYNGTADDSANWTVTATVSNVTGSLSGKTYTVTGLSADTGYVDLTAARSGYASIVKRFVLTKSKAGVAGAQGPAGPAVVVTANRALSFTATDGTLDGSQADIVLTASVSGIPSPTYAWTFSGLQTNPTASTTSSQTITAAQFGTSKSATVTCTVNGAHVDQVTIVRLEKSTAEAGATVGADWNSSLANRPADAAILNEKARANANLVRSLKTWTHGGANWITSSSPHTEDGHTLVIPSGQNFVASNSPAMNLSDGTEWVISFIAWASSPRTLIVDLFPDTLPESSVVITTEYRKQYSFVWSSSHPDRSNCVLRFFAGTEPGQIEIGEIKLERGNVRTIWTPHFTDAVTVSNPITTSNVTTYIANAAIGAAQIGSINLVGTSNFAVKSGTSGARMDMDSRRIKVFDANGVLRVQLGDLTV